MRERRPAPQEHAGDRFERDRRSVQRPDTLQLASQMGNVAFTALARSVARQPTDELIEFPEDHIGPAEDDQSESDGVIEFPEDHIGPAEDDQSESDGVIEFPEDHIGPAEDDQSESDGVIEFPEDHIGPDD